MSQYKIVRLIVARKIDVYKRMVRISVQEHSPYLLSNGRLVKLELLYQVLNGGCSEHLKRVY